MFEIDDTTATSSADEFWRSHAGELLCFATVLVGPTDAHDIVVEAFFRSAVRQLQPGDAATPEIAAPSTDEARRGWSGRAEGRQLPPSPPPPTGPAGKPSGKRRRRQPHDERWRRLTYQRSGSCTDPRHRPTCLRTSRHRSSAARSTSALRRRSRCARHRPVDPAPWPRDLSVDEIDRLGFSPNGWAQTV